jgi:hypothetical protein
LHWRIVGVVERLIRAGVGGGVGGVKVGGCVVTIVRGLSVGEETGEAVTGEDASNTGATTVGFNATGLVVGTLVSAVGENPRRETSSFSLGRRAITVVPTAMAIITAPPSIIRRTALGLRRTHVVSVVE